MVDIWTTHTKFDIAQPFKPIRVGGNGIIRACCADPANLVDPVEIGDEVVRRTCRQCGRNHYKGLNRPGRLGLRGAPMGG